jgi:2-deoxy-D-gluconate 3-dehydrogenase
MTQRLAVVTGAARGIGRAIVLELLKQGRKVAGLDLNAEQLGELEKVVQEAGHSVITCCLDITKTDKLTETLEKLAEEHGGIAILVNNAGMNIRKPAQDLLLAEWRQVLDTNLTSAFLCARGVYPHMKRTGSGKIINIGSMLSIFGGSHLPAYGASKGGLVQLTKSLAVAWAIDHIQVNAVLPGWFDTDLTRLARRKDPTLHERILARTPAGKWGDIDDLAGVAVFLASAASDFITGAAIPVDGGYSALG